MQVSAKLKYFRGSPLKMRRVARLIKGCSIAQARMQLQNQPGRFAPALLKLLDSAVANARHNFGLAQDALYVKEVYVDQGPVLKRYLPRARGRVNMIRKPTSHVTLILAEATK